MFSKPVFKQSVKANWVLWVIFTFCITALLCIVAAVHDPSVSKTFMNALEGTSLYETLQAEMGDEIYSMTTLLGVLSESIYGMMAVILGLVYVIIMANGLVASEIDRGSMAYTLSTPIKRSTVIRTKAAFLVTSIVAMFAVMTTAGTLTIQAKHGYIWGTEYTDDVTAASRVLEMDKAEVGNNLSLILGNQEALKAGGEVRGLAEDEYAAYLNAKMARNACAAAAGILGVDADTVEADLSVIKSNDEALAAAAGIMGMDTATYSACIDQTVAQAAQTASMKKTYQEKLTTGLTAAADVLGVELATLSNDMGQIKASPEAMAAACAASGLDESTFTSLVNQAIASVELQADEGEDFSLTAWFMLNLGWLLLVFAASGISFFASCVFNLTKYSLALGAGLPLAFWILDLLSGVSDSLEVCKYATINTLYNTQAIVCGGNYAPGLIILAVLGIALYLAGLRIFERKDLPL